MTICDHVFVGGENPYPVPDFVRHCADVGLVCIQLSDRLMNMRRFTSLRLWALALLSIAFLFGRAEGVHVHLCFDGQEAPASLHGPDLGIHHEHGSGMHGTHVDTDIALVADQANKVRKLALDLPVVLPSANWSVIDVAGAQVAPSPYARRHSSVFRTLSPPARGPPSLHIA
jgi:hypothetical protein